MQKILNYINGEWQEAHSRNFLENPNPATAEIYSLIPDSDAEDAKQAVEAARQAFSLWANTNIEERSRILLKISELISQNFERFALAETTDTGKLLSLSKRMDIPRAASNFHFYGTALLHEHTETHRTSSEILNYTLRRPVGVSACISPWNLPLYLFSWKIAPALAAGCSVVGKPSEITPMTAFLLSEICHEAGLPKGVLNILHGNGAKVGQALVEHSAVKAVSFTGGTATGKRIAQIAAPAFKKLSLELGGKNPTIVFADANLEEAVKTAVRAAFTNQGQICLCGSRIFVEESIYEVFKQKFVEQTKRLKVGDPLEETSNLGAVVSEQHYAKVLDYIALAKQEGGKILAGGHEIKLEGRCKNGYFIAPTVIENLPFDCRTNQEEIFGSVVTLTPFRSENEVLEWANSTNYGLSASIWTENLSRAHRMAQQIEAGIVWVNCWLVRDLRTPFGGMKQSGMGREGGFEALRFFTEESNVCIRL